MNLFNSSGAMNSTEYRRAVALVTGLLLAVMITAALSALFVAELVAAWRAGDVSQTIVWCAVAAAVAGDGLIAFVVARIAVGVYDWMLGLTLKQQAWSGIPTDPDTRPRKRAPKLSIVGGSDSKAA